MGVIEIWFQKEKVEKSRTEERFDRCVTKESFALPRPCPT